MPAGDGWAEIFANLEALADLSPTAAASGLRKGASRIEAAARASTAYQNRTGATREGTVAYVVGGGVDDSGVMSDAEGLVEDKNPGEVESSSADGPDVDEVMVILTVPTTYDKHLEERAAHLAPALTQEQARLLLASADGLKELFS